MEHIVSIQQEAFEQSEYHAWLHSRSDLVGAVAEFVGYVRAHQSQSDGSQPSVDAIALEHYPGMAEASIAKIIDQAKAKFRLVGVVVIHRVGKLTVGESIVYVGVASSHRADAFSAVDFIMDFLKNDVPIWKKACSEASEAWVEQKKSDKDAKNKW